MAPAAAKPAAAKPAAAKPAKAPVVPESVLKKRATLAELAKKREEKKAADAVRGPRRFVVLTLYCRRTGRSSAPWPSSALSNTSRR